MSAAAPKLSPEDQLLLRRFRAAVRKALADSAFEVSQIAQRLSLSERTFYRRFKQLTGRPPATYLRELRLDYARALLRRGAVQSVAEASFRVGFEDADYFARVFFRRFGQRASACLRAGGEIIQPPAGA